MFKSESGHIAFYGLVLMPFVLTLSIIAIDISEWHYLRDLAQQEADRLAYEAALILPDQTKALAKLNQAKLATALLSIDSVDVSSSALSLTVHGAVSSKFDFILAQASNREQGKLFQVSRQAKVQILPSDVTLIIADGASLRPALGADPWGNSIEWPASNYYNCSVLPAVDEIDGVSVSSDPARWATQSCFNPIWSQVKYAAIRLIDNYLAYEHNRLAVIFTPGDQNGAGFQVLRHLRNDNAIYPGPVRGGFFSQTDNAQAYWRPYVELNTRLGDDYCALLSYPSFDVKYPLDASNDIFIPANHNSNNICNDPLALPQCDASGVGYGRLDSCFINHSLTLREAIYWRAARLWTGDEPAIPNLIAALEQATIEFLSGSTEAYESEFSIRGNVAYAVPRKLIILTDTLPDIFNQSLALKTTDLLRNLATQNVETIFITFSHHGLIDGGLALRDRINFFELLAQNLATELNRAHLFRIIHSHDTEDLATKLVPLITHLGRSVALMH